ncbi:hypothetical protein CHH28_05670 [Bacterioplanes sanyensis]|uniref:Signal transduction histidine kinase subgroup 3 dimerisation and phosphoacceptor domain-containing protein n=1 Tax=Bacterioplanes sanyensis TaxID=1249553 RepID=A0A222FIZ7_9GAMM|nr:histidine kinase [Bacterioplanes sanyensis]ASP38203.1 hypothetical protein CHH28_05670 [Bacterioplanes sanyensis]
MYTNFNLERDALFKWIDFALAGLTVGYIASLMLYLWLTNDESPALMNPTPLWLSLSAALFAANWLANLHLRLPKVKQRSQAPPSLWIAAATAIVLMLMFAPGICAILWLLIVGQLPRYMALSKSAAAAVFIPLAIGLYHWLGFDGQYAMVNFGLYTLFNLFVLYLSVTLISEQQARAHAARLVTELTATQQLLASTSKRDERLRIARELHDLSGHHLAALSLQLEIAHHTQGEQHDAALQRAGVIAHLLLSEMRETVSTFRQHRGIELQDALQTLASSLSRPRVWLQIESVLTVDDVRVAEAILRSVQEALTNVVRHTQADKAAVCLWQEPGQIRLRIVDNGGCRAIPQPGNGLQGMRERLAELAGQLTMSCTTSGLQLDITLPRQDERIP